MSFSHRCGSSSESSSDDDGCKGYDSDQSWPMEPRTITQVLSKERKEQEAAKHRVQLTQGSNGVVPGGQPRVLGKNKVPHSDLGGAGHNTSATRKRLGHGQPTQAEFHEELQTRMTALNRIVKGLTSQQVEAIKEVGFGGILLMDIDQLPTDMNEWLVDCFNPVSLAFSVDGDAKFVVTPSDVSSIFGLPHNPHRPVIADRSDVAVQLLLDDWEANYKLPAKWERLSLTDIGEAIKSFTKGGPDFVRLFILYVLDCLLIPVTRKHVRVAALKSLIQVEEIKHLDWAGFVLQHLSDCVEMNKEQHPEIGCEGCVLLLLIAYLQNSVWRGAIPPAATPYVQHWNSKKLFSRVLEEKRCKKFGSGVYFRSSLLGKFYADTKLPLSMVTTDDGLDGPLAIDTAVAVKCPEGEAAEVGKLCLHLTRVLQERIRCSPYLRALVASRGSIMTGNVNKLESAADCVDEFVYNLGLLRPKFNPQVPQLKRLAGDPGASSSHDVNLSAIQITGPTMWNFWNKQGVAIYEAKLTSTLATIPTFTPPHELEIADYSLSSHSSFSPTESLFDDGFASATRSEVMGFEKGEVLSPAIMSLWIKVLNDGWSTRGVRCACLDLLSKPLGEWNDFTVLKHWLRCGSPSMDTLKLSEIIFCPFRIRSEFSLVAVNFLSGRIHCFCTTYHEDQKVWDDYAKVIGCAALRMLAKDGDTRFLCESDITEFTYDLFHPCWGTEAPSYDSGFVVLTLMECFRGITSDIEGLGLGEESKRLRKRLSFCTRLLLSDSNLRRERLISEVRKNIKRKYGIEVSK